jgi:hypothetical protein
VLEARRRKRPRDAPPASEGGGGDALYWERRCAGLALTAARGDAARSARTATTALAFVEWWVAQHATRVAAMERLRRQRERVAARVTHERARGEPLSAARKLEARAQAQQRDDDASAARRRLGHGAAMAQATSDAGAARASGAAAVAAARCAIAAAAAAAAARAQRLVEEVRRGMREGGATSGGARATGARVVASALGAPDETLRRAEVTPRFT